MLPREIIEHNSQDVYYRSPVGAVEAGTVLRLGIRLLLPERISKVLLRLWRESVGEQLIDLIPDHPDELGGMERKEQFYSAQVTVPDRGCLLWYYFIIATPSKTFYYGNNAEHLGGLGDRFDHVPPSFQITVYNKGADTPEWFRHAVMYQIFPDRFCREGNELIEKKGAVIHASWQDAPFYYKDVDTKEIVAYDFFGGNLAGIRKKLGYLRDLGISVIYLNPIFESASNHHYDTGDYHKVDPILGTNEEFAELCAEGKRLGIRFIIDGVFSHTGSDSRYFNRDGHYDTLGAFQSMASPYYEWYNFHKYPYEYDSWWGFSTLPNVTETTPSYMDFIISSEDSVLHHWLEAGISGWRLDVVDELPAQFTQTFYHEMKTANPDAVLIGEVWEDASNKISYGVPREYLCGQEIDAAMNYPFRQIVLDFLLGRNDAAQISRRIKSLKENYPKHNFYAMMNLLGSHDVARILTLLGEAAFYDGMPAIHQSRYRLDNDHFNLGVARVHMAVLWQMTFPGVPSVYYGDEISMQGFKDPYNRAPYDWEHGDSYMQGWHKKTIGLRNAHMALQTGEFITLYAAEDVYAYARLIRDGRDVFGKAAADEVFVVVFNRSRSQSVQVSLDVSDFAAGVFTEVFGAAEDIAVVHGHMQLTVPPVMGLIYTKKPAVCKYPREAGILLHPTSLPSKYGIGDFGQTAYEFIDFLASAGQKIWQVLPLQPVGFGYSPYQSPSAFAGNPMLISLDKLIVDGLLRPQDVKVPFVNSGITVDYEAAWTFKRKCLRRAYDTFRKKTGSHGDAYQAFCAQQAEWLEDYALFKALKEEYGNKSWMDWPQPCKLREPEALAAIGCRLEDKVAFEKFMQYVFFEQWGELHDYARVKGIRILGDMPIFLSQDSADVWTHQELFQLDASGYPRKVAGVPPDYFSKTGQLWGNPQYDWQAMKAEDYAWWKKRFRHLFTMVDIVRIDHFRGFEAYWEIDGHAKTAVDGRWVKGPGREFFQAIESELGQMPIVAEDLGVITDAVEELRDACSYPGMKVMQFMLNFNEMHRLGFVAPENSIVYTGTHDNNTTVGWYNEDIDEELRTALAAWLGADRTRPEEVCRKMVTAAYASDARMAIMPMQDVLALGSAHRMNMPGTLGANWKWRMRSGMASERIADWLRSLCLHYRR